MSVLYDPTDWLITLNRSLEAYVKDALNNAILDDAQLPAGLEIFDVRFDWPDSNDMPEDVELGKTIIHFFISDIRNERIGFGDNITEENIVGPTQHDIEFVESSRHVLEYDIGVWASDKSGGVTNRLIAYQALEKAFQGEMAKQACYAFTGGVEILSFNGGRFIQDAISDVRVFRVTDSTLMVRVFSRKVLTMTDMVVDPIGTDPTDVDSGLVIDGNVPLDE
jgi:hypothetical protein